MENKISFFYGGSWRAATSFISLEHEGCYVFTMLEDDALIEEFGKEIDFETDLEKVIRSKVPTDKFMQLKTAILEAVKQLPEFINKRAKLVNEYKGLKSFSSHLL